MWYNQHAKNNNKKSPKISGSKNIDFLREGKISSDCNLSSDVTIPLINSFIKFVYFFYLLGYTLTWL